MFVIWNIFLIARMYVVSEHNRNYLKFYNIAHVHNDEKLSKKEF